MKKLLMPSLACGLALLRGPSAASAGEACSQRTLFGSYLFSDTGTDKDGKPIAYAGIDYFDGRGGMVWTSTNSLGVSSSGTGSYKVRNCKAEAKFSNNSTNTFFLAPSGDEFVSVKTSGNVTADRSTRVSKTNIIGDR